MAQGESDVLQPGSEDRGLLSGHGSLPTDEAAWGRLLRRLKSQSAAEDRYRLEGEIGHGGMGAVLRVWDETMHRQLAMKVIAAKDPAPSGTTPPSELRSLSRFLEEARVTGQLDHPGIVPVHELGVDSQGRVFFTMKLVKGRTLKEVFELVARGEEGWTRTRALSVLLKVCEAMAYAHHKGVVHRDLKPANVMIGRFGEVYVMDWGLAKVLGHPDHRDVRIAPQTLTAELVSQRREQAEAEPDSPLVTLDGDVVGTPAYMSPEQARGEIEEIGPPSDVYSVGAMLYHLLAGHMPYVLPGMRLSNHAIWYRVQEGPPDPIAKRARDVAPELVAICEKAMARELRQRYADMGELARDLAAFLEHRVVAAFHTGPLVELRKWVERNRALAAASAAAVLLLIAGLVTSLVLKAQSDRHARLAVEHARLAKANEKRALEGEALAKRNEDRARTEKERAERNEAVAREERTRAEEKADEVLRLSALQELEDLIARADQLWPISPDMSERCSRWLADAESLVAELPSYLATLAELRARARPDPTLDSGWTFDSDEDRWWHTQLEKLIDGLTALSDEETGLLSRGISPEHGWGVRRRLELAREVAERTLTGSEARARWDEALASIRDPLECPWYVRVELAPQLGLLPIGRDPGSGLWEFAHLDTGEPAARGPDGKLILRDETGLVFVLLPGGTFRMGAQKGNPGKPNYDPEASLEEAPVRAVTLSPFFLSKYEMTQGQWRRATGVNPGSWGPQDRMPVDQVSWVQCDRMCRRFGLSLPSEAQWEYAARADTETPWWSGRDRAVLVEVANLADHTYMRGMGNRDQLTEDWDDGSFEPALIGRYAPNAFGLHDVHGNVWEWCQDWFGDYDYPELQAMPVDPVRTSQGRSNARADRGGSYDHSATLARSSYRNADTPHNTGYALGVRPARRIHP